MAFWSIVIAMITAFFTAIALYFTLRLYRLKSGVSVRGGCSTCSSIECSDNYVSSLTLENLKDRAITIFGIYFKLGNNYYVQVENFENDPLILEPFKTYHREYDPIMFYQFNMKRIKLNDLFRDRKVKQQIILSTSDGRYKVKPSLRRWNPIFDSFRNYLTVTSIPRRLAYGGQDYGSKTKFLVEFKYDDDEEDIVVPIYPRDYEIKKFKRLQLTKESLQSKEALEAFLSGQQKQGNLDSSSFKVHDFQEWKKESYDLDSMETIDAVYIGKFRYYVLGWLLTKKESRKLNKANKSLAKKNQQKK
jgi:hypothetical protein